MTQPEVHADRSAKRDKMAELVANCPRCGSLSITFDVTQAHNTGIKYGWQQWYEAFCICRLCLRATVFVLSESVGGDYEYVHKTGLLKIDKALNAYIDIEGFISLKDTATVAPPEHVPENVEAAFQEGSTCLGVGCNNAAAAMFRLCIDIVTKGMLPEENVFGLNSRIRRNLGLRLPWLFDNGNLPESLRELSTCVREDGNDGAHVGTITKTDADDLLDFTTVLLERIYTEPERLRLANARRDSRRDSNTGA